MRIFDKTCFIEDMKCIGVTEEAVSKGWAECFVSGSDGVEVKELLLGWVEEIDGMEVKEEWIEEIDDLGKKTYEVNGCLVREEWTKVI